MNLHATVGMVLADDMVLAAEKELRDTKALINVLNRQARLAIDLQINSYSRLSLSPPF